MNADGKNYINRSFPWRNSGLLASFEAWAFLKLSSRRFFPQIAQFDQGKAHRLVKYKSSYGSSGVADLWSMQHSQDQQTGESREDRDGDAIAGVIPKPNFNMTSRRFDDDNVGDGAEDGEIPGEGCRQRHHLPHQLGLRKIANPFPSN